MGSRPAAIRTGRRRISGRNRFGSDPTIENVSAAIAAFERTLVLEDSCFDRFLGGDKGAITPSAREGYSLFKEYGCVSCHQGANVGGNLLQYFGLMTHERSTFDLFRVPPLRMVAKTAPYFHDGSVATLDEAITIMGASQIGTGIPPDERVAIADFLRSLSEDCKARSK